MSWLCLRNCGTTLGRQSGVCLGWYPGNVCLSRSIEVSCKETGSLLGTLSWHKMGTKLFWPGDLEM